jgi:hypothetical protein
MKVALVPQRPDLLEGQVFEFGPEYGERKSVFGESYSLLRQKLDAKGHKFDSIDNFSLDEVDVCLFEDMNYGYLYRLLTKTEETPRLVYIRQAPSSISQDNLLSNFTQFIPLFDSILTWNDGIAETCERFSKHYIPQYTEQKEIEHLDFDKKKLLVNISSRKYSPTKHPEELYTAREGVIEYYDDYHPNEFTLHGYHWNERPRLIDTYYHQVIKSTDYSVYKGIIEDKTDAYRTHRFALSFENMTGIEGYVSEKMFDCLRSGIVPVYWGANNVSEYVPEDVFIDYREYGTPASLHERLRSVTEQEHGEFIKSAQEFLRKDASQFSIENYAQTLENEILAEEERHRPPDRQLLDDIKSLSRAERLIYQRDEIGRIRYAVGFFGLLKDRREILKRYPTIFYHVINKIILW